MKRLWCSGLAALILAIGCGGMTEQEAMEANSANDGTCAPQGSTRRVTDCGEGRAQVCSSSCCTPCADASACRPEGPTTCILLTDPESGPRWVNTPSEPSGQASSTPLVLEFRGRAISFTDAHGFFDLKGEGVSVYSRWVSAETPWLVLDRNENGTIDDGAELFGSMTRLRDGRRARHAFEALAELDANGDGIVDAKDPSFKRLRLWFDKNQDRQPDTNELADLAAHGITQLDTRPHGRGRCVQVDCEGETSTFAFEDHGSSRTGRLVDVYSGDRAPKEDPLAQTKTWEALQ